MAFGLFLPGLELFERFTLYEPVCDDRQMLVEHLDGLAADDLLLLDRGYPSAWLVALLIHRNIPFCMRCDVQDNGFAVVRRFMRSGQLEAFVTLPAPSVRDATDYETHARKIMLHISSGASKPRGFAGRINSYRLGLQASVLH